MTAPALLVASFGNRQASTAPTQAAVALAARCGPLGRMGAGAPRTESESQRREPAGTLQES
jgi:hypothetical protein